MTQPKTGLSPVGTSGPLGVNMQSMPNEGCEKEGALPKRAGLKIRKCGVNSMHKLYNFTHQLLSVIWM
jgi:hypothetical protein